MIISVSRRTDIPAFYSEWFYNRIKGGHVYVRNPMNIHQVSRIDITPKVVDCIVFWTKNPSRFMGGLKNLRDYVFYFQYTITGYGKQLEPNVPALDESIESFKWLSQDIGANRVIWRYDPIILSTEYGFQYHLDMFRHIASRLSRYTQKCVISFVDNYKKTIKNMAHIAQGTYSTDRLLLLSSELVGIARQYGISIVSCSEGINLESIGISHGKCIDDKLIEELLGVALEVGKDKNQRDECGCVASIDIGAYNTCPYGCIYCYANYDMNVVLRNYGSHDPSSQLLFGHFGVNDKLTERKVVTCRQLQQSLFRTEQAAPSVALGKPKEARGGIR